MKKYFVPLLTERFMGRRWSIEQQDVVSGFTTETLKNLGRLVTQNHFNLVEHWDSLEDHQRLAYRRQLVDLVYIILFNALIGFMGGDDDDRKTLQQNSYGYNLFLASMLKARSELETFNLVYGEREMLRQIQNPFIASGLVKGVYNALSLLPGTITGDPDAFYKTNSGLHKKGDSKMLFTLMKSLGYPFYTLKPEEYIVNFRNQAKR